MTQFKLNVFQTKGEKILALTAGYLCIFVVTLLSPVSDGGSIF